MAELQDILSSKGLTDMEMSDSYIPIQDKDVATKKYTDDINTAIQIQINNIDISVIDGGSY